MPTATGSIAYLGAARFQGFWNASTNAGTGSGLAEAASGPFSTLLVNGGYHSSTNLTSSAGDYWQVTGSGTTSVDSQTDWNLNDWCIYSGSAGDSGTWKKLAFEDTIASIILGDLSSSSFHMGVENDKHVIFATGSVHSGSDNFVYDYTNDRVGIGTASPAALLEIAAAAPSQNAQPQEMLRLAQTDAGVDMSAGTGPAITFYVGETSGQDWGGTLAVVREAEGDADSAAAMVFHTSADDEVPDNGREKMRITSGGNVGIGVTDPDELLEVAGDVKISGANTLFFYDSGEETISANSSGVLSIAAGAEIDLTATAIDINGNLDLDGTANVSGLLTVQTGIVPDAQDGAYLGTTSLQWSDLFLADGAVIGFGDDNEITLTHEHNNGLILGSAVATSSDGSPVLTLKNTEAGAPGPKLLFLKDSASPATGDICGTIEFKGEDAAGNDQVWAQILGYSQDATGGSEDGVLQFMIAENDGTVSAGITMSGAGSDGNITVDISTHDGSAGGLKLGGTLVTSTASELNILDGKSFVDEDNMASNSATAIASQQSIKAYVDATAAATNFVAEDGDGTEVTVISAKQLKFVDGAGMQINFTDTDSGADSDEFDLTFNFTMSAYPGVAAAHNDSFMTLDSNGSTHQRASTQTVATLFAGAGLTATNSVIAVDAVQAITSVTADLTVAGGDILLGATAVAGTVSGVTAAADAAGNSVTIQGGSALAGNTNNTGAGGNVLIQGGAGKGTAAGGSIVFKSATANLSSASTVNAIDDTILTLASDLSATFAGAVDINGTLTVDGAGVSIDSAGVAANFTVVSDGAGEDLTISLTGATDSSLILSSTGTGADALQISTSAGGMDITVAGAGANEDLDISCNQEINITSTSAAANAIYIRENGGTTGTIKIHADQGTSVTEGAASIQLLTDAGGIGIKSTANLASAVLITADGGTSETIKVHADQGTGPSSIGLFSDVGGITLNAAAVSVVHDLATVAPFSTVSYGTDGMYGGTVIKYSPGANDTLTVGGLYFLHTDGTWDATDADAVATGGSQMLGIGLSNARSVGVFTRGLIRIPATEILNLPGSGACDGLPVYVSTTAAHLDFTPPSASGDFVRIVGYAIDDNGTDVLINFDPDSTVVIIA